MNLKNAYLCIVVMINAMKQIIAALVGVILASGVLAWGQAPELQRIPNTTKTIDEESMRKVLKIVDLLEEDDDVQAVYHDMEIPEDFEE